MYPLSCSYTFWEICHESLSCLLEVMAQLLCVPEGGSKNNFNRDRVRDRVRVRVRVRVRELF
jgi:hypothetical protein